MSQNCVKCRIRWPSLASFPYCCHSSFLESALRQALSMWMPAKRSSWQWGIAWKSFMKFLVLRYAAILRRTMRRGSGCMRSQAVMRRLLEKKLQQFELKDELGRKDLSNMVKRNFCIPWSSDGWTLWTCRYHIEDNGAIFLRPWAFAANTWHPQSRWH